ncbi:Rieske (2Fe-2S) protein [Beijerinckia sp. L45]|uniref:Rieske (2Fe-2S) protein n=1 Tax=Beijerinckia sp. L45 TaxID=1641855 RepID=UPI00131C7FA3|nr:Rieske (2Fe-2S) protein [Beijerinckia sp. L45]
MTEPMAGLTSRNPWSWYPVVASQDLLAGKIMPVVLNGENLVVWRSKSGQANAWNDRCPHRGMRLSFGATQNESLICPYHGWTFGSDGYCNKIPAHPDTSPSRAARARIYPAAESGGYVWVCIGEPAADHPEAIGSAVPVRTIHLPVDVDVAAAALMLYPLDPNGSGGAPLRADQLEWLVDSVLTATAAITNNADATYTASIVSPGHIACTLAPHDASAIGYRVLLQPTAVQECVAHVAIEGSAAVGLNRAIVRFRGIVAALARTPDLQTVRDVMLRMTPEQIRV